MSCVPELLICRKRGDTFRLVFQLVVDGQPHDITGDSFALTVNRDPEPSDTSDELFSLVGVLDTPAQGIFSFAPSLAQADQEPGTYYYDVQWTDSLGPVRTVLTGKWVVEQDITK